MVIGLTDFRLFGYRIGGVPEKPPSNEKITTDVPFEKDYYSHEELDGLKDKELSPQVYRAVLTNRKISLASHYWHPISVLKNKPTPTYPIWSNVNYIGPNDRERVGEVVNDLFKKEVIERAPESCINCFPLLKLTKKNALGDKEDIRPCIDIRPMNPRLKDSDCPLPRVRDALDKVGPVKSLEAPYTTLDIKDSYFRFRIDSK